MSTHCFQVIKKSLCAGRAQGIVRFAKEKRLRSSNVQAASVYRKYDVCRGVAAGAIWIQYVKMERDRRSHLTESAQVDSETGGRVDLCIQRAILFGSNHRLIVPALASYKTRAGNREGYVTRWRGYAGDAGGREGWRCARHWRIDGKGQL